LVQVRRSRQDRVGDCWTLLMVLKLNCVAVFHLTHVLCAWAAWPDCTGSGEQELGPYGPVDFFSINAGGTPIYSLIPRGGPRPLPLLVFMHGSTGQFEMYASPQGFKPNSSTWYARPLDIYASHGFVILFPFVKSPEADKSPFTTNTDGTFILKAIEYAKQAVNDPKSPLHGVPDVNSISIVGHSMGATCTIMAANRLPPASLKVAVAQHPGVCGPFGPPPYPATWMESDLNAVSKKTPLILTTATNDGAFWPAPHTAEHEHGCFQGAKVHGPAAFVQFSENACAETGKSKPWTDGGHDCPFKPNIETPWVLRALKLYAQLNGDVQSQCFASLWGSGPSSIQNSTDIQLLERVPEATLITV